VGEKKKKKNGTQTPLDTPKKKKRRRPSREEKREKRGRDGVQEKKEERPQEKRFTGTKGTRACDTRRAIGRKPYNLKGTPTNAFGDAWEKKKPSSTFRGKQNQNRGTARLLGDKVG